MSAVAKVAERVIHDTLKSKIKTAEAKLDALKAQAETAKADIEVRAIKALLTKQEAIIEKLRELKKSKETGASRRWPVSRHGSQIPRSR